MAVGATHTVKFLLPWKPGLTAEQRQQTSSESRSHSAKVAHLKHKRKTGLKSRSLQPNIVARCAEHTGKVPATHGLACTLTPSST